MSLEKPSQMNPDDLNAARRKFFRREGGVGSEANVDAVLEWVNRALDTLPYPTEREREVAKRDVKISLENGKPGKYTGFTRFDKLDPHSALSAAEAFFQQEKEWLEKGQTEA